MTSTRDAPEKTLDSSGRQTHETTGHPSALRLGYLESAANNLAAAITIPFVVPYAVTLGADPTQVGLITALPLLAINLSQIPSAKWGAGSHRPGIFLLLGGAISRIGWLLLAITMLRGGADFPVLLAAAVAASLSGGLLSPIWTSFLGARVPVDRRGSYFGTRNLLGGVASLAGASLAALLVSVAGFQRGYGFALLAATAFL
ncbi:MAG TPA: MFS transporter, partial [Chloroflexota bacterium]|nr:MFS transporter [Chloroflexota bacterium]